MRTIRQVAFVLLSLAVSGFILICVGGVLGLKPVTGQLGKTFMLIGFGSNVLLGFWMLVECIRDKSMPAPKRRKWMILLTLGGGITAFFFLRRRVF